MKKRAANKWRLDSDGVEIQTRGVTGRTYKLDELARAAGMSARTVRYYVQRGLLPAPAFRGKDTAYAHEHLVRLKAIRRLQEAYFPLDAIAAELASRSLAEIERIADGKVMPASPDPATHRNDSSSTSRHEGRSSDDDARAEIARRADRVFRSVPLFPGVDLTVAEDAPPESVRLVEQMLELLESMTKANEGGRRR